MLRRSKRVSTILGMVALAVSALAAAQVNTLPAKGSPTGVIVTNDSNGPVYANVVLGQPPVTNPPHCTNLGKQISSLDDKQFKFTSSIKGKSVKFTLVPGVTDKGTYKMAAHETITYIPQTFKCGAGNSARCSPAVTLNYFFTTKNDGFSNNNGCSNSTFPNASNLAEVSVNFGINGSAGTGCANADDTDISAVNGVNSIISISTQDSKGKAQNGWPQNTSLAQNAALGKNANLPGVFGWAATNCSGKAANAGYPNPSSSCAAPKNAPRAVNGTCATPGGTTYQPIIGPNGTQYCDERSDNATCNNQRAAYTTGGAVKISYLKALPYWTDVEAGPIWNNADAQTKCPSACSGKGLGWNGQWTTTQEGVMSVCGCISGP